MSDNPLISIVIPTHNRAGLLAAALDSVAAQQHRPLQVVIVDDGSTDATDATIRAWSERHRGEGFDVQHITQERDGAPAARNFGLAKSDGDYILFLDDDHLLLPDTLVNMLAVLPEPTVPALAVASHGHADDVGSAQDVPTQPPPGYDTRKTLLEKLIDGRWNAPLHAHLFTRSALDRAGSWNTALRTQGEEELLVRAAVQAVGFIAAPKGRVFRRTPESLPHSHDADTRMRDDIAIRERAARELTVRGAVQTYQPAFGNWYRRLVERYGDAPQRMEKPNALVQWASRS